MKTLIKGSKIIDGKGNAIDQGALLIDGERIVGIGRQVDFEGAADVTVIDAGAKTVMPGLIDSHIHLVDNGGPHSARDSRTDSDDQMMILSVKNAFLAIRSGLTTVRDLGGKRFRKWVEQDPNTAPLVARMFEEAATGF